MKSRPGLSLRSKFTLIVLGGAVLPLFLLALWLNQTAERSSLPGGTGLGLPIAQRIAQAQGGDLSVESKAGAISQV